MPFNACVPSKGIVGEIEISPKSTILSSNSDKSEDIKITLVPSTTEESSVSVTVTILDENGNNIEGIDFQFKNGAETNFLIEKYLLDNTFKYTVENLTSTRELIFNIIKVSGLQADYKCSINVNAITSGFGSDVAEILIESSPTRLTTRTIKREDGTEIDIEEAGENLDAIPDQQDSLIDDIVAKTIEQEEPDIGLNIPENDSESIFKPTIGSEYNFYISQYEKLISKEEVHENIIPSVNYLYVEPKLLTQQLKDLRTLNGLLDGRSNSPDLSQYPNIIKDFFEEYTIDVLYQTKIKSNLFDNLKVEKTCLFPSDYSKILLPEIEKHKENFPMSANFDIFVDSLKTQLNSLLKQIKMLDYFCFCVVNELSTKEASISLEAFLRKYFSENSTQQLDINSILYLGSINNILKFNTPTSSNFVKAILSKILLTKISSNPEIVEDEILMYEIVKSYNGVVISTNYFINDFETMFLKFYDTQVKYDKIYRYDINRIVIRNSQYITKELVLSTNVRIRDLPPVRPDTTYVQYKGEDSKILINLNAGIGKCEEQPIEITDQDKVIFNIVQEHQGKRDGEKINDPVSEFEILRVDFEPKNYEDFKNAKSIVLSTKINQEIKFNASSFVDDIQPNKKYYYITRSKDVHGNLSNPTSPIQIEMINENGTIFLNKKEYIFKTIPKICTKNVRRFLEIKVAENQSSISTKIFNNKAKSAFELGKIALGNTDISVWEKTFLMRVTSKLTGKKVDIKFKFNFNQPPYRERKPKS
jgi:hypothetical protein